jgi:MFS family permease
MPHFQALFPLTPLKKGLLTSILELGAFGGSLTCSSLADRYSRKRTILLGCVVFLAGGLMQASARGFAWLFLGRMVGGWGVGMLSCLAPLYLCEIAPREIRGSLLALEQFSIVTGVVIGFWYVSLSVVFGSSSYCVPSCSPPPPPRAFAYFYIAILRITHFFLCL